MTVNAVGTIGNLSTKDVESVKAGMRRAALRAYFGRELGLNVGLKDAAALRADAQADVGKILATAPTVAAPVEPVKPAKGNGKPAAQPAAQ